MHSIDKAYVSWTVLLKTARTKVFAWTIGFILSTLCFAVIFRREELNIVAGTNVSFPLVLTILGFCFVATWLECAIGFCIGCVIYNVLMTKIFSLEKCAECNYYLVRSSKYSLDFFLKDNESVNFKL